MSAFLDLLSAYAIWIYIAGIFGILFAIKMLVDSRRQARTTMFTLEQEQAGEKAFRAVLLLIVFMLLIGSVSAVNAFIAPARPPTTPVVAQATSAAVFTPPVILPTATNVPTLTPAPASPTPPPVIATPTPGAQPTSTPARPTNTPPPPPTAAPTKEPSPQAANTYPKPNLNAPVQNDHISAGRIQFIWGQDGAVPQQLPPGQFYKVIVHYTDHNSNAPQTLVKCIQFNSVDTKIWGQTLGNAQGNALNGKFTWFVIVMQVPSGNSYDCDAGAGTPLSPPSDTWTFFWQ
jgi:hypothetical protein